MNNYEFDWSICSDWANEEGIDIVSNPLWSNCTEYRIKPKSIKFKYKLAMMLTYNNIGYYVRAVNDDSSELWLESDDQFVQWLTDWIEVEIE